MGLYIHVPFCTSICAYCHFDRTARHDRALRERYVAGVVRELDLRLAACPLLGAGGRRLLTCYLGGGTPSCLEPDLMEALLRGTVGRLQTQQDLELTAEANPETLTPELARAWRAAGVNRISLGIQSLDDGVLKQLGRACDAATARRALATACTVFGRVSADWILGPGVDRFRLRAELSEAAALGVEHFSLYLLEIHPGTLLEAAIDRGRLKMPPDPVLEAVYLEAAEHLAALGIEQYEVANFARPGAQSRHNQGYWARRPCLGLGPAAHGHWGRRRVANRRTIDAWLADLDRGVLPEGAVDPLPVAARRLERVILALRTRAGVPLPWLPPGGLDLARGRTEGLWRVQEGRLSLTGRGFLRIDTIEEALARAL